MAQNNNSNASFNDLFDNSMGRGWIVTENERNKVKATFCPEDQLDKLHTTPRDWLVKTVNVDQEKPSSSNQPKTWQLHGTAMFFIVDLLNCPTENNYFICRNVPFVSVLISGTVMSLSTHYDKYSIVVQDCTDNIICLIKQEELLALRLNEEQNRKHIELTKAFQANPSDPMLKANVIMMRTLKNLVKNIPTFEDLKVGDIVTIMGDLKEYNNKRYIFMTSIEKEPEDSIYSNIYFKQLMDLYTNTYPKF